MNVELALKKEELRELFSEIIREEVRAALTTQLDNVVVGEMAKMKLFKPGTSNLATMITNKVNTACAKAVGQDSLRDFVYREARTLTREKVDRIAGGMRDEMAKSIRSRLIDSLKVDK